MYCMFTGQKPKPKSKPEPNLTLSPDNEESPKPKPALSLDNEESPKTKLSLSLEDEGYNHKGAQGCIGRLMAMIKSVYLGLILNNAGPSLISEYVGDSLRPEFNGRDFITVMKHLEKMHSHGWAHCDVKYTNVCKKGSHNPKINWMPVSSELPWVRYAIQEFVKGRKKEQWRYYWLPELRNSSVLKARNIYSLKEYVIKVPPNNKSGICPYQPLAAGGYRYNDPGKVFQNLLDNEKRAQDIYLEEKRTNLSIDKLPFLSVFSSIFNWLVLFVLLFILFLSY